MQKKEKTYFDYLYDRLDNGIDIKIIFMSHNAYWPELQILSRSYNNCKIDIFGSGPDYISLSRDYILENCDLIIFYSSIFFDKCELDKMKQIAFEISQKKEKCVSVGYSSVIPLEKRKDKNIEDEVKVISIKNSNEYEETILAHHTLERNN